MALDTQTFDQAALDALVGKAFAEISAGYGGVLIDIGNKARALQGDGRGRAAHQPGRRARRRLRRALRARMAVNGGAKSSQLGAGKSRHGVRAWRFRGGQSGRLRDRLWARR